MSRLFMYADNREEPSGIPSKLRDKNILVYSRNLTVADYILSDKCAVERKTISDLLGSIFDGRLIDQFKRLSDVYETPILVIEGDINELYEDLRIEKLFLKTISELSIDYKVRIIPSVNKDSTVDVLITLLQYEYAGSSKHPLARRKPKSLSKKDIVKYILMGFPNVGDKLSENILVKFGSLKRVFNASRNELSRVKGVGKKLADLMVELLEYDYYKKEESNIIEQKKLENV